MSVCFVAGACIVLSPLTWAASPMCLAAAPTRKPATVVERSMPLNTIVATSDAIAALVRQVRTADATHIMQVVKLGDAPGFWSGYIPARQIVTYRPMRTLFSRDDRKFPQEVEIQFLIVEDSPWVERDRPALDESMFRPGAMHLMVFLSKDHVTQAEQRLAFLEPETPVAVFELREPPR